MEDKEIKLKYIEPKEVDQKEVNEIFDVLFEEVERIIAQDKLGKNGLDSLK